MKKYYIEVQYKDKNFLTTRKPKLKWIKKPKGWANTGENSIEMTISDGTKIILAYDTIQLISQANEKMQEKLNSDW